MKKMPPKIWVTGGYFDDSGECFITEIDFEKSTKKNIINFTPPDNLIVFHKGFTGATWEDKPGKSYIYVCGFNAVYRFSPPDWHLSGILHQPCMNDLHHIIVASNNLFVVNTGLDTIDIFTKSGCFLGSHSFQPSWVNSERLKGVNPSREQWQQLIHAGWQEKTFSISNTNPSDNSYYSENNLAFHKRKIRDFIHPNHVTSIQNNLYITSLAKQCVYEVCSWKKTIEKTPGYPHDGFVYNNTFWLSCTNGIITAYAIEKGFLTNQQIHQVDVFEQTGYYGWCRGIFIQDGYLYVGITEMKDKPQYEWREYPFSQTKTGVICLQLSDPKFCKWLDLTHKRHSKIFTIIEADNVC